MKKIIITTVLVLCSISMIHAQKKTDKKDNLYFKVKDGKNPHIYVDGKRFNFNIELIDQSKIASISVLKEEEALKKYNAPDGVILIKTKGLDKEDTTTIQITKAAKKGVMKNAPKIFIDGKLSDQKALKKLKPNNIEKMDVIKGEKAVKKYNAPNGVILITTKKN